jgi:putative transposase
MTLTPAQIWWTAAEIADARLPDMPTSARRVTATADRLNWRGQKGLARRRAGKGGGWEYHWTLLPSRAQGVLIAQAKVAAAPATPAPRPERDEVWTWFESLPATAKAKAAERLDAIQRAEALRDGGSTMHLAVIDAARMVGVAPRSIWSWISMIEGVREDDRLAYLAPRHRAALRQSRRAEIDPRFGDLVKADWLRLSQPSLTSVYDRCVRIAKAEGIPTVPIHTVRRWIERTVSPTAQVLGRKGMEALKRLRPAQERDKTALHALEAVNADFHRFDVFVRFPAGPGGLKEEIARPQMVAMQDIYSGKIVAWRLDRVPNSQAVQLCIGDMIEKWGIPTHVLMDNGREFAAKLITGGVPTRYRFKVREDDMSGLLVSLGCQVHWANPYSGQSKPIERAFRDLCDRVAKHPAFEGAYTGNRPDAKPENYGSRAVPFAEFLAVLTDELALHNARGDRRSEVAFGRSFDEVFSESYAQAPIKKATAAQRRLWLMGAEGIRTHSRTGQVNFFGNRYWADWMNGIAGQRIVARFDRAALWDGLHIYSLADEYLGFAPCHVKAGFFDVDDARAHKRSLKDWQAARKAELAAHRRLTGEDVAAALRELPPVAEAAPTATVIRPVFDGPKVRQPAPVRLDEEAMSATVVADLSAHRAPKAAPDAGRETFIRAREIERKLAAGEAVTKDQRIWVEGYRTTPEYLAWTAMVADFGESVLSVC